MTDPKHDPALSDDSDALDLPWDEDAELEDEEAAEDAEPSEAETQAAVGAWWAHLPDFIKPTYPFDLPPERMPFVQYIFTAEGAPKHCPEAACRRAKQCLGGDGPPCFRADREDLHQLLFLWWMSLFNGATDEEVAAALRARGNRYGLRHEPAKDPRKRTRRSRR